MKRHLIPTTSLLMLLTVFSAAGTAEPPVSPASQEELTAEALLQKVDDEMNFYKDRSLTTTVIVIDKDGT